MSANNYTATATATSILTRKPYDTAVATTPAHDIIVVEGASGVPEPGPDECVVHVRATGICGSDVHFWKHGRIGPSVVRGQQILGHESAGVVVKTGSEVVGLGVGDRVALEVGVPCSKPTCDLCRTGRYNGCPEMRFFSAPPIDGTLRRYHVHPAAWLHRLPDSMSFEEGALLEPLSVALASIERSGLRLGDSLAICGAGPIGMNVLLAAQAAGAAPIVITDIDPHRLATAKALVPRVRTVLVEKGQDSHAVAQNVKDALGQEAKVALECTGAESSLHAAIYATRFGGTVFIIGLGPHDFESFPIATLFIREIDIKYTFRYFETYPKAIRLVSEGLIDLKPLVTHRFKLEEAQQAFEAATTPAAKAIKVQLMDE